MKKFTLGITVLVFVMLAGCSQKDLQSTGESISKMEVSEVSYESQEKSAAEILTDLSKQQYSIQADQISDADYDTLEAFGQSFVNLYNGAVANQERVSFENYIVSENLLQFTNKMLVLEQRQELKGRFGVSFGLDNEFNEAEFKKLDNNLYRLDLSFIHQGSGRGCKLLVKSSNKTLQIVDFYFGNKDGVDTMATGHPADRKLDNPNLWNDQAWVDEVMGKMEHYETQLDS